MENFFTKTEAKKLLEALRKQKAYRYRQVDPVRELVVGKLDRDIGEYQAMGLGLYVLNQEEEKKDVQPYINGLSFLDAMILFGFLDAMEEV